MSQPPGLYSISLTDITVTNGIASAKSIQKQSTTGAGAVWVSFSVEGGSRRRLRSKGRQAVALNHMVSPGKNRSVILNKGKHGIINPAQLKLKHRSQYRSNIGGVPDWGGGGRETDKILARSKKREEKLPKSMGHHWSEEKKNALSS